MGIIPPPPASPTFAKLHQLMEERILLLDGAAGTYMQALNLTAEDFGGEALDGCNEHLCLSRPRFGGKDAWGLFGGGGGHHRNQHPLGGAPVVLAEYQLEKQCHQINLRSAQLARRQADAFSTPAKPRFVAGSIGPTTKSITVTGGISFEALEDGFYQQTCALWEGGVDFLLLETSQDTRNVKAGLLAVQRLGKELGCQLPVAVSCHHRTHGHHAGRAKCGSLLYQHHESSTAVHRHELRHRSSFYDRSPALAVAAGKMSCGSRPQCRSARLRTAT